MWRCECKDYSCRARIHTSAVSGDVLENLGDHNHDSNAAKIEVVRTVTTLNLNSQFVILFLRRRTVEVPSNLGVKTFARKYYV